MSDTKQEPTTASEDKPKLNLEEELNNSEDKNDLSELLKNMSSDENVSNLFKQFTSGFNNLNNSSNNLDENDFNLYNDDDDDDDIDLDSFNLDKYLMTKDGKKNICDVLLELKDVISNFNK